MVNRRSVESRLVPAVAGFVPPRVKEEVDSTSYRFQVHLEAKLAKFYLNDGTSNVPQTYLESEQNYKVRLDRIRRAGRPRKHSSRYDSTFKVTFGLDFVNPHQHSRKATLFANWIHENCSTQLFTVNPPLADCFTEPIFSRTHQIWSFLWNTNHSGGAGATTELFFEFNFTSKDFKLPDSSTELTTPLRLVFECYKFDSATHDWTERIERKCCVIKVFSKYGATRRHCVDGYLTALDDSTGSQYALLPESLPKDVTKFWPFPDDDRNEEEDQPEPIENEQMVIRVDEPIGANVEEDDDDDRTVIEEEEDQVVPQNNHAREEEQEVPMEIEQNDGNSVFDNENGVGIEDTDGQEANCLNTSTSRESQPYQEMPVPNVPQAAVSPPPFPLPPSTSTLNNPPLNNQREEEQQVESPNRSQEFFLAINEFEIQSRTSIDQMPTDQPNTSNHIQIPIQIINQTRIQPGASNLNQIANQSSPNQQQHQHVESPNIILPEGAVMLPISSNQYHSEESSQAINELDLAAIQSRASDQIPDVHPGTSNQFQIINQTLSNQYHHQQQQQVESPNRFPESLSAINEFDVSAIQSRTSDDQFLDVQLAASYQNQIINQTWSNHQQQQQVESPNAILPERAVMYPITSNQYYSEDSSPTYNGFNPSTLQPGTSVDQMSTDQPSTSNHIQIINQTLSNQHHHQQVESPNVILPHRSVMNQITLTPLHYSEELFEAINEMDLLAIQSPTSDHIQTVQPGASNQNQITNQTSLSNQQQHQHVELPNVIMPEHSEMLPITSTPYRYDHSEESSQAINELDISAIQPRASVNQMSPVQSGTESDQNQNQTLPDQHHQQYQQVESPNVIQPERAVMYPITSGPYHSEESSPNAINEMDLLAIQPRVSGQMADVQPGTSNLNQISDQTLPNPYLDPQFSYNRVSQEVVRNVVIKKEPIEGQKTLPLTSRDQQVRRQQFVRIIVRKIIKDEPSEEQALPPPPPPPTVNQIEQQPNDQVKVIYLTIPETLHAYPVYIYDPDDFMAAFQLALAPAFGEFTPREVRLVGQLDDGQIDTMSVNPQLLNLIANESIFDVNVSTDGVVFMAFKTDVEQPRNAQQE